ncbi:hypothetical protein C8R46DRAFT_388787 [Mycena filopes]|nr:hypothetical protein C8R46DRAFT_388787 [Mycena filopes]
MRTAEMHRVHRRITHTCFNFNFLSIHPGPQTTRTPMGHPSHLSYFGKVPEKINPFAIDTPFASSFLHSRSSQVNLAACPSHKRAQTSVPPSARSNPNPPLARPVRTRARVASLAPTSACQPSRQAVYSPAAPLLLLLAPPRRRRLLRIHFGDLHRGNVP